MTRKDVFFFLSSVDVLGQSGHGSLLVNQGHGLGELGDKLLVVAQIVTKQRLDAEERVRLVTALEGAVLEVISHGVIDKDGLALLVNTLEEAEPGGEDKDEALEVVGALHDVLGNGGHDELGQLAGAVDGQAGDLVHDGGVGEAVEQSVAVLVNVDALDLGHEGLDLLVHQIVDELVPQGVLENLVDVDELGQISAVGQSRVTGVEESELVALVLFNLVGVADDLNAGLFELGAAVDESILDDPLGEGLGDDGPGVLDAKLVGQGDLVLVGGAGCDAVDHGVGEVALGGEPVGNLGAAVTSKAQEHVSGDAAVALHVVAGEDGEGEHAGVVALLEGGVEVAEDGVGGREVALDVGSDIGVLDLELVGVFVVVVTGLGDGHGDNLGVVVGHLVNDLGGAVGSVEEGVDAADDAGLAALAGALKDCVESVLAAESVTDAGVKGLEADTADGPVACAVLAHQRVNVDGKMGSVEAADTNVDDALLDISSVVAGELDVEVVLLGVLTDGGEVVCVELELLQLGLELESRGAKVLVGRAEEGRVDNSSGAAGIVGAEAGASDGGALNASQYGGHDGCEM